MHIITFKAPENLLAKLAHVAEETERSRGYLIRKAIERYLAELEEDAEDMRIAMQRLAKDNPKKRVRLEALERKYGLDD